MIVELTREEIESLLSALTPSPENRFPYGSPKDRRLYMRLKRLLKEADKRKVEDEQPEYLVGT